MGVNNIAESRHPEDREWFDPNFLQPIIHTGPYYFMLPSKTCQFLPPPLFLSCLTIYPTLTISIQLLFPTLAYIREPIVILRRLVVRFYCIEVSYFVLHLAALWTILFLWIPFFWNLIKSSQYSFLSQTFLHSFRNRHFSSWLFYWRNWTLSIILSEFPLWWSFTGVLRAFLLFFKVRINNMIGRERIRKINRYNYRWHQISCFSLWESPAEPSPLPSLSPSLSPATPALFSCSPRLPPPIGRCISGTRSSRSLLSILTINRTFSWFMFIRYSYSLM